MEACKQSRRAWLPQILPSARPAELRELLSGRAAALLSPAASRTLLRWSESSPEGPWAVIAGPEGGFDADEAAALDFAQAVALGPHVLRIETAVEAAAAALAQVGYVRAGRAG
jgi:16S rRNA (uracil1498-N3)-methyltransferase